MLIDTLKREYDRISFWIQGDKDEAYLDAYKKWDNNCIKIPTEYL